MTIPLYRVAPVLVLAVLLAGCAGTVAHSNSVTSGSGGSGGGNTSGQLAVTPTTLDFGSVAVGSNKTLTGKLTATTADVTVSSAAWNGQGYNVTGISFPVTVTTGQSVSFSVNFAPTTSGSTPGSITFSSNATNPSLSENFTGIGTPTSNPSSHSVTLNWSPSTSTVAGYNIYRGTTSGGPYTKLNSSLNTSTSFTDANLLSSTTYYYVATAVDSSSNESVYSNQTVAAIPAN